MSANTALYLLQQTATAAAQPSIPLQPSIAIAGAPGTYMKIPPVIANAGFTLKVNATNNGLVWSA